MKLEVPFREPLFGGRFVKKTFSIILSFIMLFTLTAVPISFAENTNINFAVATDLHSRDETELYINYPESSLYFHARNTGNLYQESYGILKTMLKQASDDGLDFILIAGDMTDSGTVEQHQAIVNILSDFEQNSGIQVYITPGNHDYKNNTTPEMIKDLYTDFGFSEAISVDKKTASYSVDLPGNYRLISVDSNNPGKDGDGITDELLSWIESQSIEAAQDGKQILYMMHHPLLDPIPYAEIVMKDFIVRDHEEIAEKFTQWGIRYTFTGHEHGNNITSFTGSNGNKVYDILTTALTSYPLEYRQITCSDGNMNIHNVAITVCNRDNLVSGYTDEQLNLMYNDYSLYSYEYFKFSIEKKISNYIQPDFLKEKLNIEDGVLADAVDIVMNLVIEALNMPFYKNGTENECIEYYAEKTGVTLPETEYKNLFDLVTTLVATVYYGNENLPVEDTPEGKLLTISLNLMLKYILAEAGNDTVNMVINSISENLSDNCEVKLLIWNQIKILAADNIYASSTAMLSPILNKFLVDDEIPDRDCTIPLTENKESADNFSQFLIKLRSLIETIIKIFKAFLSVKSC